MKLLDCYFMKEISLLARQQKNSDDIFGKLAFQPWLCVNEMPNRFTSSVSCTRESTVSVQCKDGYK